MIYSELYERYTKLSWADPPLGIMLGAKWHLEKKFGDLMREELNELHRQHFPRRKKINHFNLSTELTEAIQQKWQDRAMAYYKCAYGRRLWLDKKLRELAQTVELTPGEAMQKVSESSTYAYSSQGWGAYKYARGHVERDEDLLKPHGFQTEIKEIKYNDAATAGYELWANAEPWQLDVARRRQSVMDWAVACWKRGCNPKVIAPNLPYEIFDKSCAIAMGQ